MADNSESHLPESIAAVIGGLSPMLATIVQAQAFEGHPWALVATFGCVSAVAISYILGRAWTRRNSNA